MGLSSEVEKEFLSALGLLGLESSENGLFFSDIPNEDRIEEEVLEAGGEVKDEAC